MIALLVALAACSESGLPASARVPLPPEVAVVQDVAAAWDAHPDLPRRNPSCVAFIGRLRIVDADRWDMLRLCWRDEPGHCAADASMSRWGCAAGCAIVRSTCTGVGAPWWDCTPHPIAVVAAEQPPEQRASALRHEITHLMSSRPCPPVRGAIDHTAPLLWGPKGVTPL